MVSEFQGSAAYGHLDERAEFLTPLTFLKREHNRQRAFCECLGSLADDMLQNGYEELAASLLRYLLVDVSMNIEDEDELLAPMLAERCSAVDNMDTVIATSRRQHELAAQGVAQTLDGLNRLAAGHLPIAPLEFVLATLRLTEILMRHLEWEDEELLPLAESCLSEGDKLSLGSAMARRREFFSPTRH